MSHPLPSYGGIGDFGPAAYEFVDFLAAVAKQRMWQVLPLGPTGHGGSPYSALRRLRRQRPADQPRTARRRWLAGRGSHRRPSRA